MSDSVLTLLIWLVVALEAVSVGFSIHTHILRRKDRKMMQEMEKLL